MRHRRIPYKRKKRTSSHAPWRIIFFVFLVICFLSGFLYVLFFLPIAQIHSIEIHGVQRIDLADIENIVQSSLDGKIAQQIPRSQYVLVRSNNIAQKIVQTFGEVQYVHIHKIFPNTIVIDVTEWEHVFLWCIGNEKKCYLLRDDGILGEEIAPENKIIQSNPVTRIVDASAQSVVMGENVINAKYVDFIHSVAQRLEQINISVQSDIFWTPARISHELYLSMNSGGQLLLSIDQSIDDIVKVLQMVQQYEISSEQWQYIEYIDLRVKDKVFYRLDNDYQEISLDTE